MSSFSDRVRESDIFKNTVTTKPMTARETAVFNAVCAVAENLLGKAKVKLERAKGETTVARWQTRFVEYIRGEPLQAIGKFMITPYSHHLTNQQPENTRGKPPQDDISPNNGGESTENSAVVLDSMTPGFFKAALHAAAKVFANQSPLTTAIIFALVVTAFVSMGWAGKTYLESHYDFLAVENERLKNIAGELNTAKLEIETLKNEAALAASKIAYAESLAQRANESKEASIKDAADTIKKITEDHAASLARFQANVGDATKLELDALKSQVQLLSKEVESSKGALGTLQSSYDNSEAERRKLESDFLILQGQRDQANQAKLAAESTARLMRTKLNGTDALVTFTESVLDLVREVLYDRRMLRANPHERKEDFEEGFNRLRSGSRISLDRLNIRSSM